MLQIPPKKVGYSTSQGKKMKRRGLPETELYLGRTRSGGAVGSGHVEGTLKGDKEERRIQQEISKE